MSRTTKRGLLFESALRARLARARGIFQQKNIRTLSNSLSERHLLAAVTDKLLLRVLGASRCSRIPPGSRFSAPHNRVLQRIRFCKHLFYGDNVPLSSVRRRFGN